MNFGHDVGIHHGKVCCVGWDEQTAYLTNSQQRRDFTHYFSFWCLNWITLTVLLNTIQSRWAKHIFYVHSIFKKAVRGASHDQEIFAKIFWVKKLILIYWKKNIDEECWAILSNILAVPWESRVIRSQQEIVQCSAILTKLEPRSNSDKITVPGGSHSAVRPRGILEKITRKWLWLNMSGNHQKRLFLG